MKARLPHGDTPESPDQQERAVCGAKTRSGGLCQRAPMTNGRCYLHGGKSLSGWSHPRARTGRYMAVLPQRMGDRFRLSLSDPELLALREEIALVDARIEDLTKRVESGESGELWRYLKKLIDDLENDPEASAQGVLNAVKMTIERGIADYDAWNEVNAWLDRRRKLVESERRRMVEAQQIITTEQAMALVGAVSEVIREHITDRETLAAISAAIRGLMAR